MGMHDADSWYTVILGYKGVQSDIYIGCKIVNAYSIANAIKKAKDDGFGNTLPCDVLNVVYNSYYYEPVKLQVPV